MRIDNGDEGTYESTPFATIFPLIRAAIDQWQADDTSAADISAALAATPSMSGQGTLGDENTADAVAAMGEGFVALDTAVYDEVLSGESLADFDTSRPIDVPGVLLQPDRDKGAAFFDEHAVAIVATSPKVEVVRITDVGHVIHDSRTQRGRYLAEVRRFLDAYAPA
ncbi:MAG: hypothetical protein ABW195_02115 [Ilumatobacteraceae bacterium]